VISDFSSFLTTDFSGASFIGFTSLLLFVKLNFDIRSLSDTSMASLTEVDFDLGLEGGGDGLGLDGKDGFKAGDFEAVLFTDGVGFLGN